MTATPYLLQLPDPDTAPSRANADSGADTYVVVAESSADALAFVQNYAPKKVWANVSPATLSEAADMTGWKLRVAVINTDGTIKTDQTVTNAGQVSRLVLATGVLTSTAAYAATDSVTIGTRTYNFVASPAVDGDVKFTGTEAMDITNLAHAINNSGGVPGTDYVVTAADPNVTAVAAAHTLTVTAKPSLTATQANAIATTNVDTNADASWGHATLTGGTDTSNKMSSLAELVVAALNASGAGIAGASFNSSTHTLTVAAASDNLGDHDLVIQVTPPSTDYKSPTGVNTSAGVNVPGFVGTITDKGSAGSALTVVFAADTYGIPAFVVKARVQE